MNVTEDITRRRRQILSFLVCGTAIGTLGNLPTLAAPPPGYALSWSDEFHQGIGAAPDPNVWGFNTGAKGWGNGELETYVSDRDHAQIVADRAAGDGQALRILATNTHGYESARMITSGKRTFQYGFIEARIKMPFGQGIWPAFWMLGSNISQVGWPGCGEIDIMENIGLKSWWGHNLSSLHSAGADNPQENFTKNAPYDLPSGQTFHDGYHLFQMLWAKDTISFYVDGSLYETRTAAEYGKNPWPFNAPFFFILNTAIGGDWPGKPDATTPFPQKMLVDYIRVYHGKPTPPAIPAKLTAKPGEGRQILLTWPDDVNATSYTLFHSTSQGTDGVSIKADVAATSFLDTGLTPSTRYFYRLAAVNGAGTSPLSHEASAMATALIESPYHSKPTRLLGTLQIEDFDKGGEGLAYHDSDAINSSGTYRLHDGVDIEACNEGGYDVGWTAPGEWLNYTVDVASAGTYTAAFRVSSSGTGGSFHLEDAQGHNLTGSIQVSDTGGWQNWATVKVTLTLPAGRQTLKLVEDTGGYNLDSVTFTR